MQMNNKKIVETCSNRDDYYYPYITGEISVKSINKNKFIDYLKELFFNSKTYKWQVGKYKCFIKRNGLRYNDVFEVLTSLETNNYLLKKKGFDNFLKLIEKYNNRDKQEEKISLKSESAKDFLLDFQCLRTKYLKTSTKDFAKFIVLNFDIEYTQQTLLKKLYEKEFD